MHFKSVFEVPDTMFKVCVRTLRDISTCWSESVPTNSVNERAGTVVEPSSSILAPIQQVIPNSRLVAERRSRPSSVATSTFDKTGKVLLGDTALDTIFSPWARVSCRTETFMFEVLFSLLLSSVYNEWPKIAR
jgi:hypothetical protein